MAGTTAQARSIVQLQNEMQLLQAEIEERKRKQLERVEWIQRLIYVMAERSVTPQDLQDALDLGLVKYSTTPGTASQSTEGVDAGASTQAASSAAAGEPRQKRKYVRRNKGGDATPDATTAEASASVRRKPGPKPGSKNARKGADSSPVAVAPGRKADSGSVTADALATPVPSTARSTTTPQTTAHAVSQSSDLFVEPNPLPPPPQN